MWGGALRDEILGQMKVKVSDKTSKHRRIARLC